LSSASSSEAELTIYVDGSCQDNQNVTSKTPAGWGAVVVTGDNQRGNGTGAVKTEISGVVITDPKVNGFLGAEVGSNNTAELSAIAHALRWVLVEAGESKIIIRGDSQYALEIAQKNWRAKANKQLAQRVQSLWDEVFSLRPLSGEWVRAHRGHRWNERADHLAFRAMQGEQPLPLEFWKPGKR
tara:strand:- start:4428 stop:4979 length:552 start_codon:yes stop_codon:yes gene_type:complete